MARIRTIKPEFFLSEQVGAVSHTARLLFIGLWTLADREGRLEWKPRRIRAQVFPYEEDLQVFTFAEELVSSGLLQIYESEDGVCAYIPGFIKHQRPHPKEPDSELPPPPALGDSAPPWSPTLESVYFIQNTVTGAIKIGRSRRPDVRFKELQTGAEAPLKMLCTVPPTVANERELHQRFKAHRMVGEWFQPAPELMALVQTFTTVGADQRRNEAPHTSDINALTSMHPERGGGPSVGREGKGMDKGKGTDDATTPPASTVVSLRPLHAKRNLHAAYEHPRFDVPDWWHLEKAKGLPGGERELDRFYADLAAHIEAHPNERTEPRKAWLNGHFERWLSRTAPVVSGVPSPEDTLRRMREAELRAGQ